MRIDYGLSTTSLSSLLQRGGDSTLDSTRAQSNIESKQESNTQTESSTQTQEKRKPHRTTQAIHTKPHKERDIDQATRQADTTAPRETFGLEILEKMSEREYEVFMRASSGLSEVEKMAAAQALYVFTESFSNQSTQTASQAAQSTQDAHQEQEKQNTQDIAQKADHIAAKQTIRKNPYFSAQKSFITRYIALYNGAQEVDIVG